MGRNTAKTVESSGSQSYYTTIILLAFTEFVILLSIDAVEKALLRAQADSEVPGQRPETHKILEL
jgi:hypothetical protein